MHLLRILFVAIPLAYLPAVHPHPSPLSVQQNAASRTSNESGDIFNNSNVTSSTGTSVSGNTTPVPCTRDCQVKEARKSHELDQNLRNTQPLSGEDYTDSAYLSTYAHDTDSLSEHALSVYIPRLQEKVSAAQRDVNGRLALAQPQKATLKSIEERFTSLYTRDDIELNNKRNEEQCLRHGWVFANLAKHHPSRMVGPFIGLFMGNTILWIFVERIARLLRNNRRKRPERSSNKKTSMLKRSMLTLWTPCGRGYRGTRDRKASFFDDMIPEDLLESHRANVESYARCQSRLAEIDMLINGITDPSGAAALRRHMLPKYLGLAAIAVAILAAMFVVALIPLAWNATYYCPDQLFFDPTGSIAFFACCLASAVVPLVLSCFEFAGAVSEVRRAKRALRLQNRKRLTASRMLTDDGPFPCPFEQHPEEIPLQHSSRIPTPSSKYSRSGTAVSTRSATSRPSMASTVVPSIRSVGRPQPTAPMPRERLATRYTTCTPKSTQHMVGNSMQYHHLADQPHDDVTLGRRAADSQAAAYQSIT